MLFVDISGLCSSEKYVQGESRRENSAGVEGQVSAQNKRKIQVRIKKRRVGVRIRE